jgi:hypothetical protein
MCAISDEQAAYNARRADFARTPFATFFGRTMRAAPLNYLQIFARDFPCAEKNTGTKVTCAPGR